MLNKQKLRKKFTYDPATGEVRNKRHHYLAPAGALAGTHDKGRIRLRVDGVTQRAADVVWVMMHGNVPEGKKVSYVDWTLTGYDLIKADNLYLCSYEDYCVSLKHGQRMTAVQAAANRKPRPKHIYPDAEKHEKLGKPVFVLGRPPQ